jgi:hypothetical protein
VRRLTNPLEISFQWANEFVGSIAAAWHALIGLVVSGSVFAILQSIGMTCAAATSTIIGWIMITGGVAISWLWGLK